MKYRSSITIKELTMARDEFAPVTPGEMLKEEFLSAYELSQNQLAMAIGISPNRITEIVSNRRRITADTALRLSLYFGKQSGVLDESPVPLRPEIGTAESQTRRRQAHQSRQSRVRNLSHDLA
jgi:addiction module HigA family antidote